jgi:sigma-B regulation protein RsbU (phosphoserine phosphatase)
MLSIFWFLGGLAFGLAVWLMFRRNWIKTNKRLSEQKNQLAQEKKMAVEFMHNLAEAIGEGVERKVLYQRIVHTAVITTGAMSACIYEKLPNGRLKGVAVEGLFPPQRAIKINLNEKDSPRARFIEKVLNSEVLEAEEGIVGQVSKTGKPVFISNTAEDPRIIKHHDSSLSVHSIIFSPLVHDDQTLGVLAVANPSTGLPFTDTDFSMINSLGEQAALAIKNSDAMNLRFEKTRMDADLRLAHDVQELFLTKDFPLIKGLEIDARYVPSKQVGGDFYDFYQLSKNKFCLCVADVSGKGVPASLLMALCQTHLKHLVHKNRSPAEVLSLLNEELFPRIRKDMFITLFLAILDTNEQLITYARAGHEPGMILRGVNDENPEYNIVELRGNGMALGMVEPSLFNQLISNEEESFSRNDLICLFTDGVTETTNPDGEEFGLNRLKDELTQYAKFDPQSLNQKIIQDLNKFSGDTPDRDDLTLLTLKSI